MAAELPVTHQVIADVLSCHTTSYALVSPSDKQRPGPAIADVLSFHTTFVSGSEPKLRLCCPCRSAPLIPFAGLRSGAFLTETISSKCLTYFLPGSGDLSWVSRVIFWRIMFGSYRIQAIWKAPNTLPMRAKCPGSPFGEANAVRTTFMG